MDRRKGFARARSFSLGATVIFLYILFVVAVFSGFASYIYRSEWQASLGGGEAASDIDNLIFIIKRERMIEGSLIADRAEMRSLRDEQATLESARDRAFSDIARVRADREKQAYADMVALRTSSFLLVEKDRARLIQILDDTSLEIVDRVGAGVDHVASVNGTLEGDAAEKVNTLVTDMRASQHAFLEAHATHSVLALDAKAQLMNVQGTMAEIGTRADAAQQQLDAFREKLPLGSAERARLDALSTSLPVVGNMFQRLVSFPTIFLTLIVTIAAGGLGTVVSFSRRYYAQAEEPDLGRLFVNVGEGIAAAIAIFLFSGAGMLALTQGSGAQTGVELSPYTVAFIAFLSGFMAEDAFGSIQSAGKRIFTRDADPPQGPDDPVADVPV